MSLLIWIKMVGVDRQTDQSFMLDYFGCCCCCCLLVGKDQFLNCLHLLISFPFSPLS